MIRTLAIIIAIIILGGIIYTVVRPLSHSSKGKFKIIMFGQSTMGLWFKHWNWPYPLRIKTTYKPWPIPYYKYSRSKLYLKYFPVSNPKSKDQNVTFGEKMLKSVEAGLNTRNWDAAFFKFCFVDFPVKNDEWKHRLNDLTNVVLKAHGMTSKRKMKLIVGNALPLPEPNDGTLYLQKEYNAWLEQFALSRDDVLVFDLFGPLTDQNGRFKMGLAKAKDDHHPGEQAFSILDKSFFKQVEDWLRR